MFGKGKKTRHKRRRRKRRLKSKRKRRRTRHKKRGGRKRSRRRRQRGGFTALPKFRYTPKPFLIASAPLETEHEPKKWWKCDPCPPGK